MKKVLIILSMLLSSALALNISDFYKLFPYEADSVFIEAIGTLNTKEGFEIYEIQSKNGYILFSYASKYYLLTVTKRYKNQTEIKILPQNSDFSQGNIVPLTLFPLIESRLRLNNWDEVK